MYKIETPGGATYFPPEGRCWKNVESVYKKQVEEGRFWFGVDGNGVPRRKTYLVETKGRVPWTWWSNTEVGHTQEAKKEVNALFGKAEVFSTPKPIRLIKRMLQVASSSSNGDIILDFFAGSAATAHAVLDLNKQDNGNRKFILVQLPEPCSPDSEAFKAGYRTIADIGKERIRRVIEKLGDEEEGKLDLDESSSQDRGFKVLKLGRSNFRKWQHLDPSSSPEEILEELRLHVDHIDPGASVEDLLYEILLKAGLTLVEPVETVTLAGSRLFSVAGGELLVSLEARMTKELIDAVVEAEPKQFICLDAAFHGNDQLKANTVQAFNARNMQKEQADQILFRTV